jgi:hypothetical protein
MIDSIFICSKCIQNRVNTSGQRIIDGEVHFSGMQSFSIFTKHTMKKKIAAALLLLMCLIFFSFFFFFFEVAVNRLLDFIEERKSYF